VGLPKDDSIDEVWNYLERMFVGAFVIFEKMHTAPIRYFLFLKKVGD
jgi:hypothetical protein